MSSLVSEDHSRRLERARRQYENLLINAGEVLIDKEAGFDESFVSEANYSSSPLRRSTRDVKFQSPAVNRSNLLGDSFTDEAELSEKDKDGIIISLQEEVDRLRNKLESIVSSVETVIQDAQDAQDDIVAEHDRQVFELQRKYALLEDENKQLRVTLDLSQAQLAVEQDNLLKAARFIERLKHRGREYIDVQRRSNNLLLTTNALASTGGATRSRRSASSEPHRDPGNAVYSNDGERGGRGQHSITGGSTGTSKR